MFESLSLLSEFGGGGGGGGDVGGGVIGVFVPAEFWSTELPFSSVVESSSNCSRLMPTSAVDDPLQLFVHRSDCSISSKAVFGRGGAPSCVGKRKWILQREATT